MAQWISEKDPCLQLTLKINSFWGKIIGPQEQEKLEIGTYFSIIEHDSYSY